MRPTLLGSLLDVARHNVARDGADIAIFESGTVYRADRGWPAGRRAPRDRRASERRARAPRSWRGDARRPTSSPPRRCSEPCLRSSVSSWSVEPAAPAVPASRAQRRRARPAASRSGSLGELHPLVAGAWDLGRTAVFAVDIGKVGRGCAAPSSRFRAFPAVPSLRRDLAVIVPDGGRRRRRSSRRSAAGGDARDVRCVRRLRGRADRRRRRARWRCRWHSARADRTLTDEDVDPAARARSSRRSRRAGGRASCLSARRGRSSPTPGAPRVLSPERPASPARSPRICSGATRDFELGASPRARRSGRRLDGPVSALPRAARDRGARPRRRRRHRRGDRRLSARRRRAGGRRRCASAACASSTSSADFRLRPRWRPTSSGTGSTRAPSCSREAVYGLTELHRERSPAPRSSPTPAATRRPRCSALAPLARAGLIADVVIDAKQGISGAGRAFDETHPPVDRRARTSSPTRSPRHRHTPEIEEQLALGSARATRRAVPGHLVPLDQGELASCYVTPTRPDRPAELASSRGGLRRRAVRRGRRRRAAGRARGARDELLPAVRRRRRPHREGGRVRRRSTTSGRATSSQAIQNLNLMFGLPEGEGIHERRSARGRLSPARSQPFFGSRWVAAPAHVRDLGPRRRAAGGLPRGRRRLRA